MPAETHVLILAGGGGTRLWPASRRQRPKQFLPLLPGGATLLGATVERLGPLAPPERIFVVTASSQVQDVRRAVPTVPPENIIAEPTARNTAPAIGLAALEVSRRAPDAVLAVVPADQYVARPEPYRQAFATALEAAARGRVVTIGLRPDRPETGFGYVKLGAATGEGDFLVERFVEKPDRTTAESYLASGDYLWNSGMFFLTARRALEAIRAHLPELGALLDRIARDPSSAPVLYPEAPSVSIDYGVMERLGPGEVSVVPGDFGWSDVGAWSALGELDPAEPEGNTSRGETVTVDARGNVLYAEGRRLIAAVGVSDLVIVATEDAVLVLPKDRAQDVREVVRALETSKRESYL